VAAVMREALKTKETMVAVDMAVTVPVGVATEAAEVDNGRAVVVVAIKQREVAAVDGTEEVASEEQKNLVLEQNHGRRDLYRAVNKISLAMVDHFQIREEEALLKRNPKNELSYLN
jgi:Mg-chelatase subunit ChlI